MTDLGNLKRVDPRSTWPSEARDFTPWLSEHLDLLGEALGLDLEWVETESAVGTFSIDILATDLSRDRQVVIENQLEATDHTHLGQLITYAAGVDAGTVVWISREFREEHRQAIDWLNQSRASETEFFGVALELLSIDNSKPAVNFRVVAAPNEWARTSRRGQRRGELTPKQEAYKEFFQPLVDELREQHSVTKARNSLPQNWFGFPAGLGGSLFSVSFSHGRRMRAELYIDTGDGERNSEIFRALERDREQIELGIGRELEWEELPSRRACRIAVYQPGSITDSESELDRHRRWMIENVLSLRRTLQPRVATLAG